MRSTLARLATSPVSRRPAGVRMRRSARNHRASAPAATRPSAVIDCAVYVDGHRVEVSSLVEAIRHVRRERRGDESRFVWVGLHEPSQSELGELAEVFDLHPLAVEDAVHAHQRPKLERYEDMLFGVLKTVHYVGGTSQVVATGEVMVFLGDDFVVTVRHGEHRSLGPVRRRLEDSYDLLTLGPAAVLHAVADQVVDDYLGVSDALQGDIDEVETSVFSPERTHDIERIYQLKRDLIEVKRAVAPLAEPLRLLSTRTYHAVPAEIREYFRDVEDHLARVREQVASFDELLTTVLQANLSQVTIAENEDMRKISAWVAILAIPTAISAIYGMNFEVMPALHWRFGYPLVLTVIVVSCGALYRGFRRNGWL